MYARTPLRAALTCVAAFAASAVSATTLVHQSFSELVHNANACVIGAAGGARFVDVDGATVTKTEFTVTKTAFGATPATITIVTDGGRLQRGKVGMVEVNAGAPRFFAGGEAMLLLKSLGNNEYAVVNYSQGAYNVVDTPDGPAVRLPDSVGGLTDVDAAMSLVNAARGAAADALADQ